MFVQDAIVNTVFETKPLVKKVRTKRRKSFSILNKCIYSMLLDMFKSVYSLFYAGDPCSICHTERGKEVRRRAFPCGHAFHKPCFWSMLSTVSIAPLANFAPSMSGGFILMPLWSAYTFLLMFTKLDRTHMNVLQILQRQRVADITLSQSQNDV